MTSVNGEFRGYTDINKPSQFRVDASEAFGRPMLFRYLFVSSNVGSDFEFGKHYSLVITREPNYGWVAVAAEKV